MKKELFFLLFIIYNFQILSQNLEWVKTVGGEYNDELRQLVVDTDGNIYSTGSFTGIVDFDPNGGVFELIDGDNGSELNYSQDLFLQKWSPTGELIWARNSHVLGIDSAFGITLDSEGNVLITGGIPFVGNGFGYSDTIIVKYDSLGNEIFVKTFGNTEQCNGVSVVTDTSNNIYVMGTFQNIVDFDSGVDVFNLDANGGIDNYIVKLDSNGEFIWAKNFDCSYFSGSRNMKIDDFGNLYICGYFEEICDFDPNGGVSNLTSNGEWDAYIVKLDNDGNLLWNQSFGGISIEEAYSVKVENTGSVYITGHFSETVDFDSSSGVYNLTAYGETDIFLLKLDSDGNFDWAKQYESESYDYGYSVDLDSSGAVYIAGITHSINFIDPIDGPIGDYDIIIQKYESNGSLLWTEIIGEQNDDYARSLTIDNLNNIIIGGYFDGTTDFDSSVEGEALYTSNGYNDIFILKLNQEILPIANTLTPLFGCDENSDGIYESFDTSNIENDALGGQTGMSVSYYDENGNMLPYPLPNPYTNANPYSETITVRVTNTQSLLFSETELLLEVFSKPQAYPVDSLYACSEGNGVSSAFDTSQIESQVLGNQTNMTVTYYDGNGNELSSPLPNPMSNGVPSLETITVRVTNVNALSCYDETTFDLIVNPTPNISSISDINICDDDTNGFVFFDLEQVEIDIIGSQTNLNVEFYHQGGSLIVSPLNLIENSIINQETIAIRVINTDTSCFSETTFDLIVNPLPVANLLTDLIGCDDNNDGVSEYFDTSNVEVEVLGDQTGMEVSYFDYLGNQISLSNPYTNNISIIELITVRVTNTATLCFDETILTLKTSSQPQINQPNTIYACDEGNGVSHFDTSFVEAQLISSQSGLTIIYTDTNGIILPSPLPNLFQNTESWFQTINVRVENELNSLCYSETSFDLVVNQLPIINLEAEYRLCDLEPSLYLSSDTSFYSWEWSYEDGAILSNTFEVNISSDGTYTLTIEKLENGIICSSTQSFQLIRSVLPQIESVEYKELSENNSIEIIAIGDGDFEYSIDGINYQNSNLFEYLLGGIYTAYVKDKNGCGLDSEEVIIIDYPKFFTPNNDDKNDTWQIQGVLGFPNTKIYIYDRFGKIIYSQLSYDDGWDGYYNGTPLPSADYWFSADFGNGKVFNGHFSLVRR